MMLQWIRNRIWNRRRLIFRYHDGRRIRCADPIRLAIDLHAHETFLHRHLEEAANGDQEASKIVAQAACDVFNVSPLGDNGSGLSISERVELLIAFDLYLIVLKKNTVVSPTSQTSTVAT